MEYIKYLKSLAYIFVPILVLNIFITILYYFNIIGTTPNNILKLIIVLIGMFIGGIYIGSKAEKKGWLEGLKTGAIIAVSFFIISFLAFGIGLTFKTFIYYLILNVTAMLGSMVGINRIIN